MYRPSRPPYGPPPFGPRLQCDPRFRNQGPFNSHPPGHPCPGPCGPFAAPGSDRNFLYNRQTGGHFIRPHCSSFSVDHSSTNALGSPQQIVSPTEPPPQWNPTPVEHRPPDNSDRAGEVFLRCIADNKPLPDYLKGNMTYNLADAIHTANALKEAVKSDVELQRYMTMSKSHSRSRSHERSGARRCARSKSHARSKSAACSRSRERHKSRGRSRARSKSKASSRSPSNRRNKSQVQSKSQIRRSKSRSSSSERGVAKKRKRSPSQSCSSGVSGINNLSGKSLLEGLKMVMNSKDLEERLLTLKDVILTIQGSGQSKNVVTAPDQSKRTAHQQHDSQENLTSSENENVLLPHDRVGSDFFWLKVKSREESTVQKEKEVEDEESFLYGNENAEVNEAHKSSTPLFPAFSNFGQHSKLQQNEVSAFCSQKYYHSQSSSESVHELKQPPQMASLNLASANLDSSEYEKIKNILKSVGSTDMGEMMVKMHGQSPKILSSLPATNFTMPALADPNVRQALESLQSLIKATKEKREQNDVSGIFPTSDQHKAEENEDRKHHKQSLICKMESLLKELETMLKQDELSFLTPVLGLYCEKCEEFIGDLSSAENHAAIHQHNSPNSKADRHEGDSKSHSCCVSSSSQQYIVSDKRDHKICDYLGDTEDHRNNSDDLRDRNHERDHRSKHSDDLSDPSEGLSLNEEMKKERMLITVSRWPKPLLNVRVKEEGKTENTTGNHAKDGKEKPSKESKVKVGNKSSDSSDSDLAKSLKAKPMKKKKKKVKKKRRKEKGKKSYLL